jgi:hypothetical protein
MTLIKKVLGKPHMLENFRCHYFLIWLICPLFLMIHVILSMTNGPTCDIVVVREKSVLSTLPVSQFTDFDSSKKYEISDKGDPELKPEDS